MDPGTIAQIASTAFSVAEKAWQVYNFFKDAQNINRAEEAFASEIASLRNGCNAIGELVEAQGRAAKREGVPGVPKDLVQLFASLKNELRDCTTTISNLSVAIFDENARETFFSRVVRQVRLNEMSKEIEMARCQIRAHQSSLSMILHSVTILQQQHHHQQFEPGNPEQHTHLTRLKESKQELEQLTAQKGLQLGHHRAEILRFSTAVISSGESQYASTVGSPSVYGEESSTSAAYTQSWLKDMDAIGTLHSTISTPETDTPSIFSQPNYRRSVSEEDTIYSGRLMTPSTPELSRGHSFEDDYLDGDSDDDFDVEAARQGVRTGRLAFLKQEYNAATSILQEVLKMLSVVPSKQGRICDLFELRYMLGVCTFHLQTPSQASEALRNVVTNIPQARTQDAANTARMLDASHLLAITYLRQGKMEQALSSCRETLRGRQKMLGKDHHSCYESTALLGRIHELQGNHVRAQLYYDVISEESKTSLIEAMASLSVSNQRRESVSTTASQAPTLYDRSISGDGLIQDSASLRSKSSNIKPYVSDGSVSPYIRCAPSQESLSSQGYLPYRPKQEIREPVGEKLRNVDRHRSYRERDPADQHARHQSNSSLPMQMNEDHSNITTGAGRQHAPNPDPPQDRPIAADDRDHDTREPMNYARIRNQALRIVAQTMRLRKPSPASLEMRKAWVAFLGLKEEKLSPICTALLWGFTQKAIGSINQWNLSRIAPEDVHLAALFGEAAVVDKLLSFGKQAKTKWKEVGNLTTLHCAVMGGHYDIALTLINKGCPINETCEDFGTPMALAVLGERIDLIDLLQTRWDEACAKAKRGRLSPILESECGKLGSITHVACVTNNNTLVDALIEDKQLLGSTHTTYPGRVRRLYRMLHATTPLQNLNAAEARLLNVASSRLECIKSPPLGLASYLGCRTAISYLVVQPTVSVNAKCTAYYASPKAELLCSSGHHTALTLGSMGGSKSVVQSLLSRGANLETQDYERTDPLFLAVLNLRQDCAILLLENGNTVSSATLDVAAKRGADRFEEAHRIREMRRRSGRSSS